MFGLKQTPAQKAGLPNSGKKEASAPHAEFAMFVGYCFLGIGFLFAAGRIIFATPRDDGEEVFFFALISFLSGLGPFILLTVLGEIGKNIAEIRKNSAKERT